MKATILTRLALMTGLALILGGLLAGSASAAKVGNPGNVTFIFESGLLEIRDDSFEAASEDDPATATGTVNSAGAITINSFHFPDLPPISGPFGNVNISINVLGTPTGNVNPHTGAMNLNVSVRVDADGGGVGSNCHVGPINLSLITGTTSPPSPNSPITGTPYNTTNGLVTLVDNSFSVPGASGCTTFPVNVNNQINSELGLPSPSGNNTAILTARSSPILIPAIRPSFTIAPSSGPAPLNSTLNASATQSLAAISQYRWDFDNNGTVDETTVGPTTTHTYATPGIHTTRLTVVDVQGDSNSTTRQVNVAVPTPDLTIFKAHTGDFVSGDTGTYAIGVTNTGSLTATGQITVTDTLPAGFSFAGFAGTGWSCAESMGTVTCTTDEDVPIGASTAGLTIDVVPTSAGMFTNTATVDVSGDPNASNDTAQDPTTVLQAGIDLALVKTHDAEDGLFRGRRATYILDVTNVGTLPATDRVRVTDTLPAGVSFVSAAGGLDWVCNESGGTLSCFSDEDVAPGASLEPIRIRVDVEADAPDSLTNSATVDVNGDPREDNDTGTHVGTVEGFAADYALEKSHVGEFIVGEPGFYRLRVTNVGFATGGNPVNVMDELPAGMELAGHSGDGWTCTANVSLVSCDHAGEVEPGDELPVLTLEVDSTAAGAGELTNVAAVSSDDDFNPDNDVAEDPTVVRLPRPDLAITKSHEGNFRANAQGTYTIEVANVSDERADGPTAVTDTLPEGMTYVSGGGNGWSCAAMLQVVTCEYADVLGGGDVTELPITVSVAFGAQGSVLTNVADVANADDTSAVNNHAEDPTLIDAPELIDTNMAAEGIVFSWRIGMSPQLLPWVSSTLTAGGEPVAGKPVHFAHFTGGHFRPVCDDTTNDAGVARCQVTATILLQVLASGGRYTATFAGDEEFGPSADQGALINLFGLRLL